MYRGGFARAVRRIFGDQSDEALSIMTEHLEQPTHRFGLFLLGVFGYETYQAVYQGSGEVEDLETVTTLMKIWLDMDCNPAVAEVFKERGHDPDAAEAATMLPEILSAGLSSSEAATAWTDGWYIPLVQSLRRGTPLDYALTITRDKHVDTEA